MLSSPYIKVTIGNPVDLMLIFDFTLTCFKVAVESSKGLYSTVPDIIGMNVAVFIPSIKKKKKKIMRVWDPVP